MTESDDDILFIAIDYRGRRYMGAMLLDSPALCRQIYLLLQSRIGLSIKEIGDLDLPLATKTPPAEPGRSVATSRAEFRPPS